MTIVEEIALRQTLRFGLLFVGISAALIYAAFLCHRRQSALKTAIKAVPMPAFAAAVAISFGSPLVVGALLLSAVGDIALSRDGERPFLIGLTGFALAHVLYIVHFWGLTEVPGMHHALAAALLLAFAASTEVWLTPHTGSMKWPVRVYVVLISVMGLAALGLTDMPLAVAGVFAFLASDSLLAMQLFRMSPTWRWQRLASVSLWLLYAGGQFAILAGAGWSKPLFQIV